MTLQQVRPMKMLSIIIVNYNTKDLLCRCLSAVNARNHPFPIETLVVDNGSRDGSVSMVRRDFPNVHLVENEDNVGFAKANNMALEVASGDYILLLNSDTEVLGDALPKLVTFLDSHPDVAVVSGRLVYPDFSDQGVARTFPTPLNALFGRRSILTKLFPNNKYSKRYMISRQNQSGEPFEVDWVSGACLMARKTVVDEAGLLDDGFFMYWEDADLCYRIKQKNWKIYCVPEAVVIHYEGRSRLGKNGSRLIIEFNKSAYRYYRKHHIKNFFGLKNLVAVSGLTARTLMLLAANACRSGVIGSKKGADSHERT